MTHDPEVQRAIDAAAAELARRLRPWVAGMADLDAFTARFVEDMHGQGWRPIPRPKQITAQGRDKPGDYARGAAAARQALAQARTDEAAP